MTVNPVESVDLKPQSIDHAPALVVVADEFGRCSLYPLPMAQADTLRQTLGTPAWCAETPNAREQMFSALRQVLEVREDLASPEHDDEILKGN